MRLLTVGLLVLVSTAAVSAPFGPRNNPDDQVRLCWNYIPARYASLREIGFNAFMWGDSSIYDYKNGVMKESAKRNIANQLALMDEESGLVVCLKVGQYYRGFEDVCATVNRDGTKSLPPLDSSCPALQDAFRRGVDDMLDWMPFDNPALICIQPSTEVRDRTRPSFTPVLSAAYRRHSGHEIPEEVIGRVPPKWNQIEGFPASRVIPAGHPVYDFYRWFWQEGDCWNGLFTYVAQGVARRTGGRVFTYYDPFTRTPPVWGSGGEVTAGNHWVYCYPEPYRISFAISEENAMSRGHPGQGVMAMIQCICYRYGLATYQGAPGGSCPEWYGKRPDAQFLTLPHDMMREAMWSAFSRRVDGINHYAPAAILDPPEGESYHKNYFVTDHETQHVMRELNARVSLPLGPLFRAAEERRPQVAILESAASAFLANQSTWGEGGVAFDVGLIATKANLMPAVVYEEEIERDGLPEGLEVLLMPGCEVLTEPVFKKIVAWQSRGGLIVADDGLVPGILPDGKLPEFVRLRDGEKDLSNISNAADELLKTVAPWHRPYVKTTSRDLIAHARQAGSADLLVVYADRRTAGETVGAWGVTLEKGLPVKGGVLVRRSAGAVYDLVRHAAVPFSCRDGKTAIGLDLVACDGAALLVTGKPLGRISVQVSGSVVTVTTRDRDVMVPISVRLPGAKPYAGVIRDGVWSHDFGKTAENVQVVNLATGESFGG